MIPRRALRVMYLRKLGTPVSLFLPDLCVHFCPPSWSTDEGMRYIGDPSEVTTPREEPAAGNREEHWLGLGHSRSKWTLPSIYGTSPLKTDGSQAMAFGSLMLEGCDVRISGQDVGRGTFSQR
jgi:Transketolase, pyrimidine binding domain